MSSCPGENARVSLHLVWPYGSYGAPLVLHLTTFNGAELQIEYLRVYCRAALRLLPPAPCIHGVVMRSAMTMHDLYIHASAEHTCCFNPVSLHTRLATCFLICLIYAPGLSQPLRRLPTVHVPSDTRACSTDKRCSPVCFSDR